MPVGLAVVERSSQVRVFLHEEDVVVLITGVIISLLRSSLPTFQVRLVVGHPGPE